MWVQPPLTASFAPSTLRAAAAGVAVGSITGLFGVGGGFIVVPALLLALHLPMSKAVGTSLVVVAATASAGLIARAADLYLDPTLVVFALTALAGVLAGSAASRLTSPDRLRKSFAVVLIVVALGTVADALQPEAGTSSALAVIEARMVTDVI